jgi:hypothetical protein
MWKNSDGIANRLSVPWLKENGYLVTKTYGKWFVHTPDGYTIHFSIERGGLCHGMQIVNMLPHQRIVSLQLTTPFLVCQMNLDMTTRMEP